MKKLFASSLAKFILVLTLSLGLSSYDEAGHHAVVYAIARKMGYSVKESALIADASQSLDDNDASTAYSRSKLHHDFVLYDRNIKEYPMIKNGQVFHALINDDNRISVEEKHIERINNIKNSNLSEEEKRRLSLIYLGEYLHFVADEVVHPAVTTITGHAFEGDKPDKPGSDETKLIKMMLTVQDKLEEFKEKGTISRPCNSEYWKEMDKKIQDPKSMSNDMEKIEKVVIDGWKLSPFDVVNKKIETQDITADLEKEKKIIDKMRTVLNGIPLQYDNDDELPSHKKIELDKNGNPPEISSKLDYYPDRDFNSQVSGMLGLTAERANIGKQETESDLARMGNLMYTSIGGIALDPDMKIQGYIGKPLKISLNERGIVLITSSGEYNFDDIDLQSFATILRTVAAGEIPYITIGTEPSGKAGFAKVSYAPTLQGTREGNMLFRADIQFKGIFANYPFGNNYELNRPDDPLFNGFPGRGGESIRFWIASDGIVLKAEQGYLSMVKSGMQILSETMLQGEVMDDAAMKQYTKRLTEHWNEITQKLPEFKNVEQLALITSIISWIRKNRIPIDEAFWLIPPKGGYTPEFSPYLLNKNKDMPVALLGGISLMPEFKDKGLAYKIQFAIINNINDLENKYGKGWGRLIYIMFSVFTIALSFMMISLVFWLIANWTLRPAERKISFPIAIKNTSILLLLTAAVTFIISPLTLSNILPEFDRKLLAFFFTVVASPVLFFIWAKYRYTQLNSLYLYLQKNKFKKRVTTLFLCLFPLFNAILFNAVGTITTSIIGIVPNTKTMAIIDFEITPLKTFFLANPATIFREENYMTAFVNRQQNYPYKISELSGKEIDNSGNTMFVTSGDTIDIKNLRPVIWPNIYPADCNRNILTIDGKPPY